MGKERRYLATVEFYTFAEDDEVALMMARSIAKDIAQHHDGSSAVVVKLQEKPFGRDGYGEAAIVYPNTTGRNE